MDKSNKAKVGEAKAKDDAEAGARPVTSGRRGRSPRTRRPDGAAEGAAASQRPEARNPSQGPHSEVVRVPPYNGGPSRAEAAGKGKVSPQAGQVKVGQLCKLFESSGIKGSYELMEGKNFASKNKACFPPASQANHGGSVQLRPEAARRLSAEARERQISNQMKRRAGEFEYFVVTQERDYSGQNPKQNLGLRRRYPTTIDSRSSSTPVAGYSCQQSAPHRGERREMHLSNGEAFLNQHRHASVDRQSSELHRSGFAANRRCSADDVRSVPPELSAAGQVRGEERCLNSFSKAKNRSRSISRPRSLWKSFTNLLPFSRRSSDSCLHDRPLPDHQPRRETSPLSTWGQRGEAGPERPLGNGNEQFTLPKYRSTEKSTVHFNLPHDSRKEPSASRQLGTPREPSFNRRHCTSGQSLNYQKEAHRDPPSSVQRRSPRDLPSSVQCRSPRDPPSSVQRRSPRDPPSSVQRRSPRDQVQLQEPICLQQAPCKPPRPQQETLLSGDSERVPGASHLRLGPPSPFPLRLQGQEMAGLHETAVRARGQNSAPRQRRADISPSPAPRQRRLDQQPSTLPRRQGPGNTQAVGGCQEVVRRRSSLRSEERLETDV